MNFYRLAERFADKTIDYSSKRLDRRSRWDVTLLKLCTIFWLLEWLDLRCMMPELQELHFRITEAKFSATVPAIKATVAGSTLPKSVGMFEIFGIADGKI